MPDRAPSVPFAWGWVGFDLGDARPCDATYSQSRAILVRKSTAFPCHL
jgi:hypothetical protein